MKLIILVFILSFLVSPHLYSNQEYFEREKELITPEDSMSTTSAPAEVDCAGDEDDPVECEEEEVLEYEDTSVIITV